MGKHINSIELTETLTLSECSDGFWLYDKTRRRNLSIRAKTPQDAFVEALGYYQSRLSEVEKKYKEMSIKVYNFVDQFSEDYDT
jgi:hypothetical protein